MPLHLNTYEKVSGGSSTLSGTFDEAAAAGNSLVALAFNDDKRDFSSLTSSSLTFALRVGSANDAAILDDMDLAASKSIGDTFTATWASSSNNRAVIVLEFDGVAEFVSATAADGNSTSPSISRTVSAGDTVIGLVESQNASALGAVSGASKVTLPGSITEFTIGVWRCAAYVAENVSAGTFTFNPTCTGGADYGIAMAVYTPPAGSTPTTITVTAGTMAHNGQTVAVIRDRVVPVTAGTIAYAGQVIASKMGRITTVAAGAIAYTGQAATTIRDRVSTATAGTLNYAGQAIAIAQAASSSVTAAAMSYTGQTIATVRNTVSAITAATMEYAGRAITTVTAGGGAVVAKVRQLFIGLGIRL